MNIGASTANLYPLPTEEALQKLLELGFRTIEVFVNTESEVAPDFAQELRQRADAFDARIVAVHPYGSVSEPYLLFSDYHRRLQDGIRQYQRIFRAACIMGARYVILHGDRVNGNLSDEQSAGRFEMLYDVSAECGVTLLQENVVRFRSSDLQYLRTMRSVLGDKAQFAFDIKQCERCGFQPEEVIDAMGSGIRHVHVSDHNTFHDCMLPGKGTLDYPRLLSCLRDAHSHGDWILELYRCNFSQPADLADAYQHLVKTLN